MYSLTFGPSLYEPGQRFALLRSIFEPFDPFSSHAELVGLAKQVGTEFGSLLVVLLGFQAG